MSTRRCESTKTKDSFWPRTTQSCTISGFDFTRRVYPTDPFCPITSPSSSPYGGGLTPRSHRTMGGSPGRSRRFHLGSGPESPKLLRRGWVAPLCTPERAMEESKEDAARMRQSLDRGHRLATIGSVTLSQYHDTVDNYHPDVSHSLHASAVEIMNRYALGLDDCLPHPSCEIYFDLDIRCHCYPMGS
ncbi:hypothetical protein JAAARDRAFT_360215 [Jaapia argillacea MUCL 33604]|uniref:Uncharacterized protein n=1 Tax=Jaapia argillacea MUCL 33604 TaxID=933084 RepID=A0A067Q7K7_9AGAM|nr:hypothetical protein JAAARDRAFT_360215 [Jaapia argillacea MUCL 33604]